ncbi:hypothetical protein B9T12_04720 [Wohlfahrtiimonas chitiniclastica]|uniref:hypothetical protein n=1 Tax=Wohlfahrtiimonas chitiniclastica TaxID=400946 RepID=UPI000B99B9E3|nr:hypothetical protein [Wohlfahrtiimonas chitiniclastica]OYQ79081.1 hypothetical protein B9T12_04720 [Wohlfahrtiimonas chitiniclastica]
MSNKYIYDGGILYSLNFMETAKKVDDHCELHFTYEDSSKISYAINRTMDEFIEFLDSSDSVMYVRKMEHLK